VRTRTTAAVLAALIVVIPAAAAPKPNFLQIAENGAARARKLWFDPKLHWYRDRLEKNWRASMPLARLWTAFPLFETLNAIAIAQPTAKNRLAVAEFAAGAEKYWNPTMRGYAYYPGTNRKVDTYFDDNGWWGIAFLDAFQATHRKAYLADALRAYRFILEQGWDPVNGGTWWDTQHHHRTAEPLAAAAYMAARLYRLTRNSKYLADANRLVSWADENSWNAERHLYQRSETSDTVMNYVQGMMIGAQVELCRALDRPLNCNRAEALARASLAAFPRAWNPVADSIYLRFVLELYKWDANRRWYDLAYGWGVRALQKAALPNGLFLKSWDGKAYGDGLLWADAGTLSLFAWLATAQS
jgi:hypothetical protein